MDFPTKNDHFGVLWGYRHLRNHPYTHTLNTKGDMFLLVILFSGWFFLPMIMGIYNKEWAWTSHVHPLANGLKWRRLLEIWQRHKSDEQYEYSYHSILLTHFSAPTKIWCYKVDPEVGHIFLRFSNLCGKLSMLIFGRWFLPMKWHTCVLWNNTKQNPHVIFVYWFIKLYSVFLFQHFFFFTWHDDRMAGCFCSFCWLACRSQDWCDAMWCPVLAFLSCDGGTSPRVSCTCICPRHPCRFACSSES